MHFLEKYKLMVVKILSKFELRRVAQCVGAKAVVKLVCVFFAVMFSFFELKVFGSARFGHL